MENYFEDMVSRIVRLSTTDGWREFAFHWAKDLEKDKTGIWSGLVAAVQSRRASLSAAQKSGGSKA